MFLDWFSTDYQNQDGNAWIYIITLLEKLNKIGCRVIFLFFPNRNIDNWENFYHEMKRKLEDNHLEYIELDEILASQDKNNLLRDTIHTTTFGSIMYAREIYDYLCKSLKTNNIFCEQTPFSCIKKIAVKKVFYKKIELVGNCKIIGLYNIIGRYSGIINVSSKNGDFSENLWDEWCYYNRKHFNLCFEVKDNSIIKIDNTDFDTSVCKYSINFNKYRKKIFVDSIYYTGEKLKILSGGSRFIYFLFELSRMVSHFLHIIWLTFKKIFFGK